MHYSDYSVEDFATDDYFAQWINQPDPAVNRFWESFLTNHPEKKTTVDEARQMVILMNFETSALSGGQTEALLRRIHQTIGEEASKEERFIHTRTVSFFRDWYKVAAVLAGALLVATGLFYFSFKRTIEYVTRFGETRNITLPDGSTVTLNANSRLEVAKHWDEKTVREVKLQGEAFFSVVHTRNHRKFIVLTSDQSNVEVLGTKFNVNNRHGKTKVVLNSGKVKLSLETDEQVKNVIMQPGDMAEISEEKETITKRLVKPEVYSSWRSNTLTFDDTPLSVIAQLLEDNYGLKVEIRDAALAQRKYTGTAPADNVDVLLTKLAKIFDARVIREDRKIVLTTQ